jgi:transposase InsO family protein
MRSQTGGVAGGAQRSGGDSSGDSPGRVFADEPPPRLSTSPDLAPFPFLKEECVWLHNFTDFTHARREVTTWIHRYNTRRPHSSLGYKSPAEYRAQQLNLVV